MIPERIKINELVNDLRKEDEWVRYKAVLELGYLREKAITALPELKRLLLKDESTMVRRQIAIALGEMRNEDIAIVPALLESLQQEKESDVRYYAADALENFGEHAAELIRKELKRGVGKKSKFELIPALTRIEGKKGGGLKVLSEMKNKGELNEWQIEQIEKLELELKLRDKIAEVKEAIGMTKQAIKNNDNIKSQINLDSIGFKLDELLPMLKEKLQINEKQQQFTMIEDLRTTELKNESIRYKGKVHWWQKHTTLIVGIIVGLLGLIGILLGIFVW